MDINDILYIIDKECDSELASMLRDYIKNLQEEIEDYKEQEEQKIFYVNTNED